MNASEHCVQLICMINRLVDTLTTPSLYYRACVKLSEVFESMKVSCFLTGMYVHSNVPLLCQITACVWAEKHGKCCWEQRQHSWARPGPGVTLPGSRKGVSSSSKINTHLMCMLSLHLLWIQASCCNTTLYYTNMTNTPVCNMLITMSNAGDALQENL